MSPKDSPFFWFLLVIIFVTISCVTYLWVRWIRPIASRPWRKFGTATLLASTGLLFLQPMVYRGALDVRAPSLSALAWVSYSVMGYLGLFLIYSLGWDGAILVYRTLLKQLAPKRHSEQFTDERRRWLWGASRVGIASVSLGSGSVGIWQAAQGPRVVEVAVPIEGLHPDLEGLRIAQVSDLHIGPTIDGEYVQDVVSLVQSTQPDMIALTGDLVDGSVAQLGTEAQILGGLNAPLGVYFCTGNHEYFSGAKNWIEYWTNMGVHVLGNRHRMVQRGSASLLVGGVHDRTGTRFIADHKCDPFAAIAGAPPQTALKILLAHQPTTCTDAAAAGFDLMLSGHTHGGQFFPWNLFVTLAHPYTKGLHLHLKKLWVYVNSGTGYWGPPLRFGLPAEVTVLVLTNGTPAPALGHD